MQMQCGCHSRRWKGAAFQGTSHSMPSPENPTHCTPHISTSDCIRLQVDCGTTCGSRCGCECGCGCGGWRYLTVFRRFKSATAITRRDLKCFKHKINFGFLCTALRGCWILQGGMKVFHSYAISLHLFFLVI